MQANETVHAKINKLKKKEIIMIAPHNNPPSVERMTGKQLLSYFNLLTA
jgi:hypothetical protein